MKRHKGIWSTLLLVLTFLVGLSLLLYPTVSDYWNSLHQSQAIVHYAEAVADIDNNTYQAIWEAARDYNAAIAQAGIHWKLTEAELAAYNTQLAVSNSGVMGYLEIPKIHVNLPIYHGTSEAVLQTGLGHIEGSSLPVGGESTHAVLSGHRGLPSAKLLTDLDEMTTGDTFLLNILDETLTYEVDQILIVEPYDLSALGIAEGRDYCTLVTCTPYGINSHRLLVRGHRIDTVEEVREARVTADAVLIEPVVVAPLVAAPMLLILLIVLLVRTRRRR